MAFALDKPFVERLRSFVASHVRCEGCDHTHRFSQEWARLESVNWDDLLDLFEAYGAFCDCEVVTNLPGFVQEPASRKATRTDSVNPWLLPPDFGAEESALFHKVIVCQAGLGRNTYGVDGEILVPAPKGAKARKRVRKSVNFFIGCQSGLPCEVGVVQESREISALDFARNVAASGFEELARFGFREAAFVLSKIASLKPSQPVGTHFADRVDIASKHEELTIHRVFIKR